MNESKFWKQIKEHLKPHNPSPTPNQPCIPLPLFMKRIDAAGGIPDIFMKIGSTVCWIELKVKAKWPKRAATTTNLGLAEDQAVWSYVYSKARGISYILVWVEGDYLLFRGSDAMKIQAGLTQKQALDLCIICANNLTIWKQLEQELINE